jgi:phosphatidylserine/phosphatidylglycerophosphate/cardiolipin synthase-like enzyme
MSAKAAAYANGAVVFIAWRYDAPLPGCLGFQVRRIDATGQAEVLPAWVGFQGTTTGQWDPRDTSVWPVQKFTWRDLTAQPNQAYHYEIVPMTGQPGSLQPHQDLMLTTNTVRLTTGYGNIAAAFTNGILSTQFLAHQIRPGPDGTPSAQAFLDEVRQQGNALRVEMAGDVLPLMLSLPNRVKQAGGTLYCSLYELTDEELIAELKDNQAVHLILSNTGPDDKENAPARQLLHDSHIGEINDRMLQHLAASNIGHNKFMVYLDPQGKPQAVFTGSTNWTPNGLCAQSNNAMLIESPAIAQAYYDYWQRLKADQSAQAAPLRDADATAVHSQLDNGATDLTVWYSPNTPSMSRSADSPAPPDLAQVFDLMDNARQAILFAVFEPGFPSVVSKALDLKQARPDLLVSGAVSMAAAIPHLPVVKGKPVVLINNGPSASEPVAVPATALKDPVGEFEQELLSAGNAIIHDKIVVLDPLSDDCTVVMGSHNLGYKASYANDENLLIIRGNKPLAQAYAVHVLDLYDHYRFRYLESQHNPGAGTFTGFLQPTDAWQSDFFQNADNQRSMRYWAG